MILEKSYTSSVAPQQRVLEKDWGYKQKQLPRTWKAILPETAQ